MVKRGRPFGSKNTKLNKTFMLTLEHFPDLWQATLHFNGKVIPLQNTLMVFLKRDVD